MLQKSQDDFYLAQQEPVRSCLVALREIILTHNNDVTGVMKYGMPFFCYKGKMFCYLWVHKKYQQPYLGIVEGHKFDHPDLIIEKRSRMKIMLFDPKKDLPVKTINAILKKAVRLYTSGEIKLN